MKTYNSIFEEVVSAERLFEAWFEFRKGKTKRRDVQEFGRHLERNVFRLHRELVSGTYHHSPYSSFFIQDPKIRHIRKACVRDRLVHQALYTVLTRIFEPRLVHDIYSSRLGKGTHAGVNALWQMTRKVSKNDTRPCWALKCDIRKFYDTVDHAVLIALLGKTITDKAAMWVVGEVIGSFHTENAQGRGLPIGNLTSQIFTNVYLNELDQFVKHSLRAKHYVRFADDFVLLSQSKDRLNEALVAIDRHLRETLRIELHPYKVEVRPLHQGIDFLGYVTLPHHRVMRTKTKRRMLRKLSHRLTEHYQGEISGSSMNQALQSYIGMLSHADTFALQQYVRNVYSWRTF